MCLVERQLENNLKISFHYPRPLLNSTSYIVSNNVIYSSGCVPRYSSCFSYSSYHIILEHATQGVLKCLIRFIV